MKSKLSVAIFPAFKTPSAVVENEANMQEEGQEEGKDENGKGESKGRRDQFKCVNSKILLSLSSAPSFLFLL